MAAVLLFGPALLAANVDFFIEAEDFNYGGGKHVPASDVMPYAGGAYNGLGAIHDTDYHRAYDEGSSPEYRQGETPNVPMNANADMERGRWTLTVNYKIGWTSGADWYNYTRNFPEADYLIYAGLSYGDTSPDTLRGTMQRITSNPGQPNQQTADLGIFDGAGSGGWGLNNLVPCVDGNGNPVAVHLGANTTVRFTAGSGDIDYYVFEKLSPPRIARQPQALTATEGQTGTFTVLLENPAGASYQWRKNGVDLTGATSATLVLAPVLYADQGASFDCRLWNARGATNSATATLTVQRDAVAPLLLRAYNVGLTNVQVVFSEPVEASSGLAITNYTLSGGPTVKSAAWGAEPGVVVLTTSALGYWTTYTLAVQNVRDRADLPNPIAPDTKAGFTAIEYVAYDIGKPGVAGTAMAAPGGFDLTGAGSDIGGNADQFQFAWQSRTGDFDLQSRVANPVVTDPFFRVGLMARESLDADARFAGVFASSVQLGCLFAFRDPKGNTAATLWPPAKFPVNYPQTWLRLRRTGNSVLGFGSFDGVTWYQLGTQTFAALPARIYVGFALASEQANVATAAQFRDVGPTKSTSVGVWKPGGEPLGQSSRRTGLVFSEIMYHPSARLDGKNLAFVELYNARAVAENLSGWRLSGDIDYRFPDGFWLRAGDFVVVAANPADLTAVYSLTSVLGPYTNSLPHGQGRLRLRNNLDALRLEVDYQDGSPWPVAADGAGHSLVLARPSYGEADPRAWAASQLIGGSPGGPDTIVPSPYDGLVINELLTRLDETHPGFVELFNPSTRQLDLSGCALTDDPLLGGFRVPDRTLIKARGFLSLDENQLGFRLSAAGGKLFLVSSNHTRMLDALKYGAQENGVAYGRSPDASPTFRRLARPTPAGANARWRAEDLVINEIMYHPISGGAEDEYVELHNRTAQPMDLSGWRFVAGISYEFPTNTSLPAAGFLVVAKDAAHLIPRYPQLNATNTLGDYGGTLGNQGDRLALAKPAAVVGTNELGQTLTNTVHIVVAEVVYGAGGRWGHWADGGGSSLELIDPEADVLRAASWADSDETSKAAWTTVGVTNRLDNGNTDYPPNRLHIGMLGAGECLVDDVEIFRTGGANLLQNPGFEAGANGWSITGNHSESAIETAGAASGNGCLHVRGSGDGDTGVNSIRGTVAAGLASGNTAVIRAKVRWLAGWPEILFRTRGNWLELPGRMALPSNLGTPGLPNSRLVPNAGPAIFDVTHTPALPASGEAVLVTCGASDPDGIASVTLRYRTDPASTLTTLAMRDDGLGGDVVAGDGLYSATIPAQGAGTLLAFRVQAYDAAAVSASSLFPARAPAQECLIRWGEPAPTGNFSHFHLWSTTATENARGGSTALNNTMRDATLVYGNSRVIYNVGFRDKGSPWHGGGGDIAVTTPPDEPLLGAADRVFASTGNGGSEPTGIRSQLAAWLHQQLGVPYLYGHYTLLYRNGGQFREVMEDLEQPNTRYAESWFPTGLNGDLYKVAMWFEFQDDNSTFGAASATIEKVVTTSNAYKLGRYRWMFQRRANDGYASNYTNLFDLVAAANNTAADFVPRLLNLADVEEWMRVFACGWLMSDWDMWSYNVGQNMYAYKQPGDRWVLMRWDIDFTFGLGDGPTQRLWSGQDPVINRWYDTPALRRMLWRCYQDAVNGPLLPEKFQPQIDMRRAALLKNNIWGLAEPSGITTFINQRRAYIQGQLKANDAAAFAITTNGGKDLTNNTPTVILAGTAPFVVASIAINGTPFPVTWTSQTAFQVTVPLGAVTNVVTLTGLDRLGAAIPGATKTITIKNTGALPRPEQNVVINEIQYDPLVAHTSFVELYNRSSTTPFDLSGFRLDGVGYTFAPGAVIASRGFLLVVKNRVAFANAYGQTIPVFDEFPGSLANGGEHLALVRPGAPPKPDTIISDVQYLNRLPWPTNAAGWGASLQLLDPTQDTYRVGNWYAADPGSTGAATPGRANLLQQTLVTFPPVWLNEVLPGNLSGLTDNAGQREPWIELYNSSDSPVDLSPYYLTDTYTNLAAWQFPAGATLGAKQFMLVWADGDTTQSTATALHTNFRLPPTSGAVALTRLQGFPLAPVVMDYVEYVASPADRSVGSFPDGEPRRRRPFYQPTPGTGNNPALPVLQVTINEVMAANTHTLLDATGTYEGWFELHNAADEPADLTGYVLTDSLANPTQFSIPAGTVLAPGAFLLVWADNAPALNQPGGDLHVSFGLNPAGEAIGLFGPDGALLDSVSYGQQASDVSLGRFPDGTAPPLVVMDEPTPRGPNYLRGANKPPLFEPVGDRTVEEETLLTFAVTATDPDAGQVVTYSLGPEAPPGAALDPASGVFTWTPAEEQGPGRFTFALRATDNGTPPRTVTQRITVTVGEVNRPPVLAAIADQVVDEGALLTLSLSAADPDLPVNALTFELLPGAPEGVVLDARSGLLTWLPTEAQGPGQYELSVRVTDDGVPALSDTFSFQVTVNEVSSPPVITQMQAQTADELAQLRLQVVAVDADRAGAPLSYSLDAAPAGALIEPNTGLITWTPTEAQGPTNAVFLVRVAKATPPFLSATMTFGVAVRERNEPPVLAPISDLIGVEGQPVTCSVSASDPDIPAQVLTFSLGAGAPAGATMDPVTGVFRWEVDSDFGARTVPITVRVTDDGPGTLSASRSVNVTVQPRFHGVINEIMYRPAATNAEYIELFNNSARSAVELGGLRLTGGQLRFDFGAGTRLQPGQFLLVVRDAAAFARAYPGVSAPVAGAYAGALEPGGDTLRIIRPGATPEQDEVLNSVTFGGGAPWPAEANGAGASLQLLDPTRDSDRVGNWAASAAYTGPRQLLVITNLWRYYQSGPLTNPNWTLRGFDDGKWGAGGGILYVENAALPWPKTTPLALGQLVYYFRARFTLPVVPKNATLIMTNLLDDGAVYYLNGKEVLRVNLPEGPIAPNTLALSAVGDASLAGPFALAADALVPGENVFAVEVHQINPTSSDIVMGCTLNLEGGNVIAFTPGATNNVAAALPAFPPLRLNEAVARNTTGLADARGHRGPWLEIVNTSDIAVGLDGLYLTDTFADLAKWAFPTNWALPGGGFLVVFADGEPAETSATELHTGFALPQTPQAPWLVALARLQNGQSAVVDYLRGQVGEENVALGRLPDGDPASTVTLTEPTPGVSNQGKPAVLVITRLEFNDRQQPTLSWVATPGANYVIEAKPDLNDPAWRPLATVQATAATASFTDQTTDGAAQRFYRIRRQ